MELLETIKCEDGKLFNLDFHQTRFDKTRLKYFSGALRILLADVIEVPSACQTGLYRCRVIYSRNIEKVEFIPHQYHSIKSLKLVEDNEIDYSSKFANRQELQHLFNMRGNCDDILIVKEDCITDSFTANPIFFDGKKWWTPDTPLLAGTQRARYIANGAISACKITQYDLNKFQKAGLINALQDMNDMPVIEIDKILSLP